MKVKSLPEPVNGLKKWNPAFQPKPEDIKEEWEEKAPEIIPETPEEASARIANAKEEWKEWAKEQLIEQHSEHREISIDEFKRALNIRKVSIELG